MGANTHRPLSPPFNPRPWRRPNKQNSVLNQPPFLAQRDSVSSTPAYRPRFDPLNLGSNAGGGPRRGGDLLFAYQREGEKKEYGRDVAATKFRVEPREIYYMCIKRACSIAPARWRGGFKF